MKIRYLQLIGRLNLPGIGAATSNKLSANGSPEARQGMVRTIEEAPGGYVVEVPNGPHRGHYFVPMHRIEHAGVVIDAGSGVLTADIIKTATQRATDNSGTLAAEPKPKRQKPPKPEPPAAA